MKKPDQILLFKILAITSIILAVAASIITQGI